VRDQDAVGSELADYSGVLIECEPAIKSIIVHIDSKQRNDIIIEDLDESHLVVKENMVLILKQKLEEVSCPANFASPADALQQLKETYRVEAPLQDSD